MNWEITKIKSLRAIPRNPNATKSLNGGSMLSCLVGTLWQIPLPLSGEESLILQDSWIELELLSLCHKSAQPTAFVPAISMCFVVVPFFFFWPSLSEDLGFLFISLPSQPSPTPDTQEILNIHFHDHQAREAFCLTCSHQGLYPLWWKWQTVMDTVEYVSLIISMQRRGGLNTTHCFHSVYDCVKRTAYTCIIIVVVFLTILPTRLRQCYYHSQSYGGGQ